MRHLRLDSVVGRQNVTYHCKNSHAYEDNSGRKMNFIKMMSNDNVEMHKDSHSRNQPTVLSDGCKVSQAVRFLCKLSFFMAIERLDS